MTDKKQPEALRLADALERPGYGWHSTPAQCAAELRRLHAENETLRAKIKTYEDLGDAADDMQLLRTGYAAARLEIESLKSQSAAQQPDIENLRKALQFYAGSEHFIKSDGDAWDTVSGEPQNYWCDEAGTATVEDGHIARLALSGHPVRFEDDTAQPAAHPGAAHGQAPAGAYIDSTPDLHVGDSSFESWYADYVKEGTKGLKQHCRDAYAAGMGDPLVRASPAAVAGCTRSHPHENMDNACRAKSAIAEMQNMAARGAPATAHDLERFVAMLAAAPTTQPAPQQEPILYDPKALLEVFQTAQAGSSGTAGILRGIAAVVASWESRTEPHAWLIAAPQPSPAAQEGK